MFTHYIFLICLTVHILQDQEYKKFQESMRKKFRESFVATRNRFLQTAYSMY